MSRAHYLSLWLSPSFIAATLLTGIANPRSAIPQRELSVASYHSKNINHFRQAKKHIAKAVFPRSATPRTELSSAYLLQKQTSHYTYAVACTYILNNVTFFSRHIKQIDNLDPLGIRHSDRLTRTAPGKAFIIIAYTAVRKLHHSRIALFHALLGVL